tara:strand:+ start:327 stop:1796 length:1470 start_codon:yes stop_codon:yes gene_type:complete
MSSKNDNDTSRWTVTSLLMEVMHCVESKDFEKAREFLSRVLEIEPENGLAERYREVLRKAMEVESSSSDESSDESSESDDDDDDDDDDDEEEDDDDEEDNENEESHVTKRNDDEDFAEGKQTEQNKDNSNNDSESKHDDKNNNNTSQGTSNAWKHFDSYCASIEKKKKDRKMTAQRKQKHVEKKKETNVEAICHDIFVSPVTILSYPSPASLPLLEIQYWKTKIDIVSSLISKHTSTASSATTLRLLNNTKKECEWNLKYLSVLTSPFQTIQKEHLERVLLSFTPMMQTFESISKMSRYYNEKKGHLQKIIDRVTRALIFRVSEHCDARFVLTQTKTLNESMKRIECAVEALSKWLRCCRGCSWSLRVSTTMLESALRKCSELKCLVQAMNELRSRMTSLSSNSDDEKRYDGIKTMISLELCDSKTGDNVNIYENDVEIVWENLYETAMCRLKEALPSKRSVLRGRLHAMVTESRNDDDQEGMRVLIGK